jgi:hypothetical protein
MPVDDQRLHELLVAVGKDVPVDQISRWASTERDAAQRWAEQAAKGTPSNMPPCVQRSANHPLVQ